MSKQAKTPRDGAMPDALVPVAAWTADAATRKSRSEHAAATYRANMADEAERARIDAIATARSDVLPLVAGFVAKRMQSARGGSYGVGEMAALVAADAIGQQAGWAAMPATGRRWTIRRVFRAMEKEGAAKQTTEERKGRRVRCWSWVPMRLRA